MEVEFLSNMRYSLLASKEQWAEWQTKLGKFADYFARASKIPLLPSPVGSSLPTSFPSVTVIDTITSPALSAIPANSASFEYNQQYHPHYPPAPALPQTGPTCKKRPFDDIWAEPPPKRAATISVSQMPTATLPSAQVPSQRQNMPRLPVPSLSISTSSSMGHPDIPTNPPSPTSSERPRHVPGLSRDARLDAATSNEPPPNGSATPTTALQPPRLEPRHALTAAQPALYGRALDELVAHLRHLPARPQLPLHLPAAAQLAVQARAPAQHAPVSAAAEGFPPRRARAGLGPDADALSAAGEEE